MPQLDTFSDQELFTACGGKIEDPGKFPSAIFQGKRVYFCARACLSAFESDPERFMTGEIDHPIDEDD